jgi:hypothetical protein
MTKILAADRGKEAAIDAFVERVKNQPKHIDNSSLAAGSPMYSTVDFADIYPTNYRNLIF